MPTKTAAALSLALACCAAGPAAAATCRMTVLGAPVIDGAPCTPAGPREDRRLLLDGGGAVTIRRSFMSARLPGRPRPDGTRSGRFYRMSFGQVVASYASPDDDKTCYFNQKATLCVEP